MDYDITVSRSKQIKLMLRCVQSTCCEVVNLPIKQVQFTNRLKATADVNILQLFKILYQNRVMTVNRDKGNNNSNT